MEEKRSKYISNLLGGAIKDGQNRNYEAAIKKLKTLLTITDDCPQALLYLGRAYHELKYPDDAVLSYRMFISREPKSSAGYFYLGRTYLMVKKFDKAAACFYEAARLNEEFAPAHAYYGYAMLRCGAFKQATEHLQAAVELEPENSRIYTMYINSIYLLAVKQFRDEEFDSALKAFGFLEEAGFTSISIKLYTGIILKEQMKYEDAVPFFEEAASASPDDILIKNLLAEVYIKSAKLDEAVELLNTYMSAEDVNQFLSGLERSEDIFAEAYWKRSDFSRALHFALSSLKRDRTQSMHLLAGECLKHLGKLEEAFNHFLRAEEFDKNSIEPKYGLATVQWMQQDFESMLKVLNRLLRINSEDQFATFYLPLCRYNLNRPYGEWMPLIDKLEESDKNPWLLTAQGYGFREMGNNGKAIRCFKKAAKIDPEHIDSWNGLITSLQEESDEKQLLGVLKTYLSHFSNDDERSSLYIDLLIDSGSYKKAASAIRVKLAGSAPGLGMLKRLAYCLRKAENYSDAGIIYRQILSMDPYSEKYLKRLLFCMRKDGKDAETVPLLRAAVDAFESPSMELLLVYGVTLYRNNLAEEALNVFQSCIYKGYKDYRIFKNMSVIYQKKDMMDWSEMYKKKSEELKKN